MQMRVAVVGASGSAGGELLRLICGHPDLDLTVATADSSAGKTVGDVHANLAGHRELANLIFEPHSAVKAAQTDLIFLALPGGQSAAMAAGVGADIAIVDLGPDFRLADPADWARHYGGEHPGRWVTGLPELPWTRPLICNATRVAAPGCYATAAILALAPVVGAGLVAADDVVVVAASGTSGAGRSLRADLLGSEVMGSVSAYQAAGTHRHTPEIEQALAEAAAGTAGPGRAGPAAGGQPEDPPTPPGREQGRGSFTPPLPPLPRGIPPPRPARLPAGRPHTEGPRAAPAAAYADEPFVHLLPAGRWPGTAAVAGSNGAVLQAAADPPTR